MGLDVMISSVSFQSTDFLNTCFTMILNHQNSSEKLVLPEYSEACYQKKKKIDHYKANITY